ncbi:hypothetical protein MRB53_040481 [Persea americana]|nr:hypothetical protein MRB53_040481 [Persea americana]
MVLALKSNVSYSRQGEHIIVKVTKGEKAKVHAFEFDSSLQQLQANDDLDGKLYLAYLHALTSFCLPDPLNHHTGTESALTILRTKAVESFQTLTQSQTAMLSCIAKLSPGRRYYPTNEQVMQNIDWDVNLSFLSQHGDFSEIATELWQISKQNSVYFHEEPIRAIDFKSIEDILQQRDHMRSSTFKVSGFGAEYHNPSLDRPYICRDMYPERALKASFVSRTVSQPEVAPHELITLQGRLGQAVLRSPIVYGPDTSVEVTDIRYDGCFLDTGIRDMISHFPSLHRWIWIVNTLVMCCRASSLHAINAPKSSIFNLRVGIECEAAQLNTILAEHRNEFENCPEYDLVEANGALDTDAFAPRKAAWLRKSNAIIIEIQGSLAAQWPSEAPETPACDAASTYIDMRRAMPEITARFQAWHFNGLLLDYTAEVEQAVGQIKPSVLTLPILEVQQHVSRLSRPGFVSETRLFTGPAPLVTGLGHKLDSTSTYREVREVTGPLLEKMLQRLRSSEGGTSYEKGYNNDLSEMSWPCKSARLKHLRPGSGHVSRPVFLLKRLARNSWNDLPKDWQTCVVEYATALTELHRAQRLVALQRSSRHEELSNELSDVGHENWSPHEYPESLLIEVEGKITIRKVQEDIAREMRAPPDGANAVMQLNMGEGKSSVIIPMVATALANGSQLVRVVVGKAQSKQMAQMLISKLGGMVNRRVCFMPFSRSIKLLPTTADQIARTLRECMTTGSILLVQPEHILSFKLAAPEYFISGQDDVGASLLSTQDFLDAHSRDLVDESDENFSLDSS